MYSLSSAPCALYSTVTIPSVLLQVYCGALTGVPSYVLSGVPVMVAVPVYLVTVSFSEVICGSSLMFTPSAGYSAYCSPQGL